MSKLYKFGPFRLGQDPQGKNFLFRGDEPVRLTPKQFEILRFLVENSELSISATEILEKFWPLVSPDDGVEINNVTQNISALRKALGDSPQDSKYIRTIGSSYRFVKKIEIAEATDEDEDSDEHTATSLEEAEPTAAQRMMPHDAATELNKRDIRFHEWRRGPGKVLTRIAASGVLLTVALSLIVGIINSRRVNLFASITQVFMLIGAFGYILPGPRRLRQLEDIKEIKKATGYDKAQDWDEARDIATKALARYTIYWHGILATWALLYLCLFLKELGLLGETSQTLSTTFFNNCNTALLILCYNLLNQPIEIETGKRDIRDTSWVTGSIGFVAAFFVLELFLLPIPDQNRKILFYVLSLMSGIAGGIAMALYVGRLQSKFLGPSPKLVIALYSYTAIQSLFIFIVDVPKERLILSEAAVPIIAVILINIALMLKCLLYLYMAWLFQSGRLLFYLVRVRRTYKEVDKEMLHFRKVLDDES